MEKLPRWALWGSIGAIAGLLGGYVVGLMSGTATGYGARNTLNLFEWLTWDWAETGMWFAIGGGVGALLSYAIRGKGN
jgi:hypothetical protein